MSASLPMCFLAVFLGAISRYESKVVMVPTMDNLTLEYFLCTKEGRKTITNDTEIKLNASVGHNMSTGMFCFIQNVSNLTLSGAGSGRTFSNITCASDRNNNYTSGFGFVNIHNLIIKNLHITKCAGKVIPSDIQFKFSNQLSTSDIVTTLLLSHCHNVKLQQLLISTDKSNFLVIEEVLGEILVEDVNTTWLCSSTDGQHNVSPAKEPTGMVDVPLTKLDFSQSPKLSASAVIVVITVIDLDFDVNINWHNCICLLHHCGSGRKSEFGHMYFNISTSSSKTTINFTSVRFSDVTLFAYLHFNTTTVSNPAIEPFQLYDCDFTLSHSLSPFEPQWNKIVVKSEYQDIQIRIGQLQLHNSPLLVYSQSTNSNTSVIITEITTDAAPPDAYSTLYLVLLQSVILNGSHCDLHGNSWSAIVLVESELHLDGCIKFESNRAPIGGAIYSENSLVFFHQGAKVQFVNNEADLIGGAIYATNSRLLHNPLGKNLCALQLAMECRDQPNYANLMNSLNFINNTAGIMGSAVYASPLYYCHQQFCNAPSTCNLHDKMNNRVITTSESNATSISSNSYFLHPCDGTDFTHINTVYPGGTLEIMVKSTDICNTSVPVLIHADIVSKRSVFQVLLGNDTNEATQSTLVQKCSHLKYTFLVKTHNGMEDLTNNISSQLRLQFGLSVISNPQVLEVNITPCPTGFQFSPQERKCICSEFLSNHSFTCDIAELTTTSKNQTDYNGWLGGSPDNISKLAYTETCCNGYCSTSTVIALLQPDSVCINNHTGFVCGQCNENYSVVLGPRSCHVCHSKFFPLVLFLFLIGGIMFVLSLWALQMTVDKGMLTSLAFCASVFTTVIRTENTLAKTGKDNYSPYILLLESILSLLSLRYNNGLKRWADKFAASCCEFWSSCLSLECYHCHHLLRQKIIKSFTLLV